MAMRPLRRKDTALCDALMAQPRLQAESLRWAQIKHGALQSLGCRHFAE